MPGLFFNIFFSLDGVVCAPLLPFDFALIDEDRTLPLESVIVISTLREGTRTPPTVK